MMADSVSKETDAAKSKEYYRTAADYFHTAAQLSEKLLAAEPANAVYRRQVFGTRLNESTARLNSGENETALKIQQGILENVQREANSDSENAQAQQDVASTLSQIGLTHLARQDFPAASAHFRQAVLLLEQLIKKDGGNSELQQDCFNNYVYVGDTEMEQRDFEAAKKTYRAAFDFAQQAPKLKDAPFAKFADGLTSEKIGVCWMTEAENTDTISERRRKYQTAAGEFQKALAIWQEKEFAPEKFGLSEELNVTAQAKAAECAEKAALLK
jgi:tetratricopeptide (TPR) repeat protein